MVYEHDEQARDEASKYALPATQLAELRASVESERKRLREGDPRNHQIPIKQDSWDGLLPAQLANRSHISRGDVFTLAKDGSAEDVFKASFIWGMGTNGYGPSRLQKIIRNAGDRLAASLQTARSTAADDVIAGYANLWGGYDHKNRARPLEDPWVRLDSYGPAFFTKFLYFTTPGALILDKVLATAIKSLTQMPYLIQGKGNSYAWSPYRYAVVLHWMNLTAESLSVEPDLLELTLFRRKYSTVDSSSPDLDAD